MSAIALVCASGLAAKAPAAFVVAGGGTRLCLDLGRTRDASPDPDRIGACNAVLLSHQHPDHADGLSLLPRIGDPPVHATAAVARSLGRTCLDLPLAGRRRFGPITVTTGRDGHALGGVWLHAALGDEALLYCGDVAPDGSTYPFDPPPAADAIVLDASYGTSGAGSRERVVERVLAHRGPVLLPAPASGRGLELAVALAEAGRPPTLCPATRACAETALADPDLLTARGAAVLRELFDGRVASGARPGGRVHLLDDPTLRGVEGRGRARGVLADGGLVLFTGHLARGAPGHALLSRPGVERLRWPVHPSLSRNVALARGVGARSVVPAFCDRESGRSVARAIGLPLHPATDEAA